MKTFAFLFDSTRCTGCKTCVLACKDYHDLGSAFAFRQVYERESGSWTQDANGAWTTDALCYYVSLACNHCASPACTRVCPTGAMHKEDDGFVIVNEKRCIGCGYCALSCPYHAPKLDDSAGHSVKCDGCADHVRAGRAPICVEACPQRALAYGEFDELVAEHGYVADIAPLPDHAITGPCLVVLRPAAADIMDAQGNGWTANVPEIV